MVLMHVRHRYSRWGNLSWRCRNQHFSISVWQMQANLHVSCGAMFVAQRHERTSSYLGSGQKFSRATQFWCHLFEARPHRSAPPGTFSNVEEPNRAVAVDQNGPGMNSAPTVESLDHDHAYDTYDHRPRRSRSSRRSRSRRTRFTRR